MFDFCSPTQTAPLKPVGQPVLLFSCFTESFNPRKRNPPPHSHPFSSLPCNNGARTCTIRACHFRTAVWGLTDLCCWRRKGLIRCEKLITSDSCLAIVWWLLGGEESVNPTPLLWFRTMLHIQGNPSCHPRPPFY